MYALNSSASEAFQLSGNGNITINCGIAVKSNATSNNCNNANQAKNAAAYINGSATVTSTSLSVTGTTCVTGSGSFTQTKTPADHSPPSNPYSTCCSSFISASAVSGLTNYGAFSDSSSSNGTLQPGVYSSITVNGTEQLAAGTYYVEGGNFNLNGTLTGTGVTIVLTSTSPGTGTSVGTFTMANNATASISAPLLDSGSASAGYLIVQDSKATLDTQNSSYACGSNCNVFIGGPNTTMTGVIYFPSGNVTYQGNASSATTGCLQILADTLNWSGTPTILVNGCSNVANTFGPTTVALKE